MFEYAIGHYQKRPPSSRLIASWIVSCLAHATLVLILLEYPQILRGGMNIWFRQPSDLNSPLEPDPNWRNLVYVGSKMEMPPPEVLKKYIYDWNRAKEQPKEQVEERPAVKVNLPPAVPAFPTQPKPGVSVPEPKTGPPPAAPPDNAAGDRAGADVTVRPSKSAPPASAAIPPDTAPKEIPKGVTEAPKQPPSTGAKPTTSATAQGRPPDAAGVGVKPADQQTGMRMEGSGLFDTRGFPLEDYANLVKDLVKGNWMIPSNLRESQGSTTITFYINKNGQLLNARIEVPSGNNSLDIAALSAVFGSNPFPPLPQGFPADRVGARLVFAYNERQ